MKRWKMGRRAVPCATMLLAWGWLGAGVVAGPHAHTMPNELSASAYTPDSLYQLTSTWTTAAGQRLQLGELRGTVRVVVMHYTSCEYACPILINLVKRIEAGLPQAVRHRVGFVGITFDPERDTLPVLQAYQAKMHLDSPLWTLLRGQSDDTLELAVLLGIKYRQNAQGEFSHTNLITVLNQAGEIVHRQTGLHQNVADTISVIHQVALDASR